MTAIVLGCYAVAWLLTARVLYGRWRGELMQWGGYDKWCQKCHELTYSLASDRETAIRAIVAGLLWWGTLLTMLVTFRPPPTVAERAGQEKKLKARIAELEREAGIKP